MKIYDLLWRRSETRENKEGKTRWEKVGILVEKDNGRKSIKINMIPAGDWDGWLVVSDRDIF